MAARKEDVSALCGKLIEDARRGVFKPVYVLMGDEPYYPDLVCSAIIDNCIDEFGKDFNETICFGADVTPDMVITSARRYPMMADRQLVVVKEAQMMKGIEELASYCEAPLESTVLVLLLHNATLDKRRALYKIVSKVGAVVDSPALRDYEIPSWINSYYASRGLRIEPAAASLLAESAGTDLSRIAVETDKLLKNLPEGVKSVSVQDIETNVGISRQYNVFELNKLLSLRNASRALVVAGRLGNEAKFQMPAAISAMYTHFYRILRYGILLSQGGRPSTADISAALAGVHPAFYKEYDQAVRNYPVPKAMAVISLLCDFDYRAKGGDGEVVSPAELMVELTARILNV
ncbi:MAG: DNA polymerase III subunit delta [Bacteroidales bacterium]|nr:DNA polymerase III subunit delta [Bacteroidales bacterium]